MKQQKREYFLQGAELCQEKLMKRYENETKIE